MTDSLNLMRRLAAPLALAMGAGLALGDVGVREIVIGQSEGGRRLVVQRIADASPDAMGRGPDERPALVIVAGLDARHRVGVDVAGGLADLLMNEHAAVLEGRTVYVLSDANPDGTAMVDGSKVMADFGRAPRSMDADGDRRTDEDPGEDLNGDGMITMMRVFMPLPETGLKAEWVPDPEDPRLMRKPDGSKGEIATHAMLIEGIDNDRDGKFNEDGFAGSAGGGVHLDMNFPTLYPELTDGAGRVPLDRSETRAIVEWLQSRTNVQAVLVYGPGDTLRNIPPVKQYDESGRIPKGLEEDDKAAFERIAEAYKEHTGDWSASKHEPGGSLTDWAYGDLGVWSLRSSVWGLPKAEKKKDDAEKPAEEAAEAVDPAAAEREALIARGVEASLVTFLTATADERGAIMAEFDSMSPEDQGAMMASVQAAPADVRDRVMAMAQGLPDPGAPETGAPEAVPAQSGTEPAAKKASKPKDSEDAKWMAYLDEQRGGEGFVAWKAFDHPQLGSVEIGGFAPGVKHNPPSGEADGLAEGQAAFVADVLSRLAEIKVGSPVVERVSAGLYRVSVSVMNTGELPTVNTMGEKTRRLPPEVIEIDLPATSIVGGTKLVRMSGIEGGDTRHAEWLVAAGDGSSARLLLRSPRFGDREMEVRFGN